MLCDPPYSNDLSGKIYSTGEIKETKYVNEAVRACRDGGYIGLYHWVVSPRPKGTRWDRLIVILGRIRHHVRVCSIFQKTPDVFGEYT